MKKILLTVLCIAGFAFTTDAQNDKGDFTLAPQLGLNLSNYRSNVDLNNDLRVAMVVGVTGGYYFSDRWSFRTGLLYDAKGTDVENNIDKLNYLSIPLQANFHFGDNRNWYVNFGPSLNVLLSAKGELSDGSEIDLKDQVSSLDIGLGYGIGYKFDVSENTELFFQAQSFYGLSRINENNNDFGQDVKLFNISTAISAGLIFDL